MTKFAAKKTTLLVGLCVLALCICACAIALNSMQKRRKSSKQRALELLEFCYSFGENSNYALLVSSEEKETLI